MLSLRLGRLAVLVVRGREFMRRALKGGQVPKRTFTVAALDGCEWLECFEHLADFRFLESERNIFGQRISHDREGGWG